MYVCIYVYYVYMYCLWTPPKEPCHVGPDTFNSFLQRTQETRRGSAADPVVFHGFFLLLDWWTACGLTFSPVFDLNGCVSRAQGARN